MTDKTYNGWTNYETWAVAIWIDNDQGSSEHWNERAQEAYDDAEAGKSYASQTRMDAAKGALAAELRDSHEEQGEELGLLDGSKTGVFSDLVGAAMSEVDWHSIAEHYLGDVEQEPEAEEEAPATEVTS